MNFQPRTKGKTLTLYLGFGEPTNWEEMIQKLENTKAYKGLDGFKQDIVMKRSNRLQIEEAVLQLVILDTSYGH